MKDVKRWLPGALVSILLIAAILYFVDVRATWNAIRNANYRILMWSAILSFIWMFVRAKVWQTLMRDKPKYVDVMFSVSEGYLLNNFLPFRLGELGRAFLLSRKSGIPFSEILPTVVIERVVDVVFSAALLLIGLPFVTGSQGSARIGYIMGGIMLLGLVMMYILARNRQWTLDIFHKLSARWSVLEQFGGHFLESFMNGLAVLTDGWLFLRFLLWMTFNWAVALVAYYLITLSFFPQAQFNWMYFVLGATAFGGAIPALPGSIGTFEGAISAALTLFTKDQSASLAVALTARLYNYLNSTVLGGIGLSREGETLAGVYRQLMNLRSNEKAEEKQ